MAKVEFHPALGSISGKSAGYVFRRQAGGKTVIARSPRPEKPAKPTSAQKTQRDRFARAWEYAKRVLADPVQRRAYETLAKTLNRRADKLVIADFLTPPVVDEIDVSGYRRRSGGVIRILATDDIEVVSVNVTIQTEAGAKVESGAAAKVHGVWCYPTTAVAPAGESLSVTATARDRPDHAGSKTVVLP